MSIIPMRFTRPVYRSFGGYNGTQETKTLPGFFFKLYLRSDLEKTDKLMKKEDGSYDYVTFSRKIPMLRLSLQLSGIWKSMMQTGI